MFRLAIASRISPIPTNFKRLVDSENDAMPKVVETMVERDEDDRYATVLNLETFKIGNHRYRSYKGY